VGDRFSEEYITDTLDKCNMDGEAALCKLLESGKNLVCTPIAAMLYLCILATVPSRPPTGDLLYHKSLLTPRTSYLPNTTSEQQQLPLGSV